jgi:hypothetical protein
VSVEASAVCSLLIHFSKAALAALEDPGSSLQMICAASQDDAENFVKGLHCHNVHNDINCQHNTTYISLTGRKENAGAIEKGSCWRVPQAVGAVSVVDGVDAVRGFRDEEWVTI